MSRSGSRSLLALTLLIAAVACGPGERDAPPPPPGPASAAPARPPAPVFEDVTEASGIAFVHDRGAEGRRYLPETMGSGGCTLDADGDGLLDLYLVQSGPVPGSGSSQPPLPNRLWRNLGDGRFDDVTEPSGAGDLGHGMGATCADFDSDGDTDIFVVNFGPDALLRNDGGGRFTDVTAEAGVAGGPEDFGSSAAFLDADADGDLDLFVVNYVEFTVATHVICRERGMLEAYCHPDVYEATPDRYFENVGGGRFRDATREAGLAEATGKGLGIVVLDFDDDADPDVFVANDSTPNQLWRNDGRGRFEDVGQAMGVAFSEDGKALAGMGVDAGDIDGDGRLDVVVTNFAAEPNSLFINGPHGFRHGGRLHGIHGPSLPVLGFGADFLDVNLDAHLDLLIANGHIIDNIAQADPAQSHPQPAHLFLGTGKPPLKLAPAEVAGSLAMPAVARGTITWDPDSDGRLDLVVTMSGERVRLHRNVSRGGRFIGFLLRGARANRDGVGARVTVETEGRRQVDERRAGSSYQTSGDPRLHFGVADAAWARVTVRWSASSTDVQERLETGRYWLLAEGEPPRELRAR